MSIFLVSWNLIQSKKYWKDNVRFIFQWRKWLFWEKYKWQCTLSFHHFSTLSIWAWTEKKHVELRVMRKKLNIFTLQLPVYYILIGNLNWCKCGHCKNEAIEKYCLCCRKVDAKLIALAETPGREGSISPSSFYGQLPNCEAWST